MTDKNRTHDHLDVLIEKNIIKSYRWVLTDLEGEEVDQLEDFDGSGERLILEFQDGTLFEIDSVPGNIENSFLLFEVKR